MVEYRGSKSKHTLTVCSHIVGYDLLNQLGIFNLRIHKPDNNFVVLNKKGRKKGGSNRNKNKISKALVDE